jgi:GntR family transcriptional regulator of arabinose operon
MKAERRAKYQRIHDYFHEAILEGAVKPGDQLPTEYELCAKFAASRPTVGRAMGLLAKAGLVERRAGSGTYVLDRQVRAQARRLGLLIPGLRDTEIFDPISTHLAAFARAQGFDLVHGTKPQTAKNPAHSAGRFCDPYVAQGVKGVFFAPLELDRNSESINRSIVRTFETHGIVVVLIDRDLGPFPRRSECDLVGLDNLCAGYMIAAHLLRSGCRRIDFLALPYSAQTVVQRLEGVRAALHDAGTVMPRQWVHYGAPDDAEFVQRDLVASHAEAVVCANDVTAGTLMTTLLTLGVAIPQQIRLCGFDDVKSAALLPVPLTTIHQPCAEIARIAMLTMLDRFTHHKLPVRRILLPPRIVVRNSCGG